MYKLVLLVALSSLAGLTVGWAAPDWKKDIQPLFINYCFDCHGDGSSKGDVSLDSYETEASMVKDAKFWDSVNYQVENWVMPPPEKKQPTDAERKLMADYLDELLYPCDCDNPDPGRPTINRLNREQYNNTMRDLFGIDVRPADEFPPDDSGYGFDNIGDVLTIPPILMERYLMGADKVLDEAIVTGPPEASTHSYDAAVLTGGKREGKKGRMLEKKGAVKTRHLFRHAGSYKIRAQVWADKEPAKATIQLGKTTSKESEVTASRLKPEEIEAEVTVTKGSPEIQVTFENPGDKRRLYVGKIEVEGPFQPKADALPVSHTAIFGKQLGKRDSNAAEQIIRRFGNRAFRRPIKTAEVKRLAQFVSLARSRGESFEMGIKQALRAMLVSPHFLFRIEWQPEPNNPKRIEAVTEYALAARLSYFLWSSVPDNALLSLAFQGKLREQLPAQVLRMLADPKADELARNFGGQWLETRNLQIHEANTDTFPQFTPALREAMAQETTALFLHIMRTNRSVTDFLTADYTFVNKSLAKHYDLRGVTGDTFQQVSLKGTPRRGVLTHASVLTVTSDPTRTSPVKRGKWVLDNLLGTPPPPPPPNVPELEDNDKAELKGSLRERMEEHRSKPGCASCHRLMDPLGFGLENYGPLGAWRDKDGSHAVEATGQLTSGQMFEGSAALITILSQEKRELYHKCLTRKLLTYALGRGLDYYDKCAVNEILGKLEKDDRFQTLIMAVVESVPFQKRRGDGYVAPKR
jgi:hypothetical protein